MDEIKGSIKRQNSVLYHFNWLTFPKKKTGLSSHTRTSPLKPRRSCTSFTSIIRRLPVIAGSLRTKRSISAVFFPFPLTTKGKTIGLQPSPPTPANNRVINRVQGAEVSPCSLRQWAKYWILTSRWHTTPLRAIPHGMEGRWGRRTSVTTRKVYPLTAQGRA